MNTNEKKERFLGYANEIKNLGYKVYIVQSDYYNYGWIVNDKDEIGYFQLSEWGFGVTFSTCHKPMKEYGTGFRLDDNFDYHTEFSRELVDRVFAKYPDWMLERPYFERKYLNEIRKYSAKEFLENHWDNKNIKEL